MSNVKQLAVLISVAAACFGASVGLFEGHEDVGKVLHPGSVVFDPSTRSYTVTGSGENMWSTADAFQFVWKKVSGDVMLTADISFPAKTGDAHKKAVLMIRQSLDAGSAYADAALHGNGLTSLQARDQAGAATHEIQANVAGPTRLRIEKRGAYLYMSVGEAGQEPHFSGGSMKVALEEPFYIGIGVCAHNKDVEEQAVFSNVKLKEAPKGPGKLYSTIETITVSSTDRRVTAVLPGLAAAPSWSREGSIYFAINNEIARIPVEGGEPNVVVSAPATSLGLSPDESLVAFGGYKGIFVVPLPGGKPRRVVKSSATLDGWSPDGRSIFFESPHGIYSVPAAGGKAILVPIGGGNNLSPEFSADGKHIYFSSDRSGSMQIWTMLPDGSEQEQITSDSLSNYLPRVSPDGRRLVFSSLDSQGAHASQGQDVTLRMMLVADKKINVLAKFKGTAGTWSPDGRRVVLITYQERP